LLSWNKLSLKKGDRLYFEVLSLESLNRLSLLGTILMGGGAAWIAYPFIVADAKVGPAWVFGPSTVIFSGFFCFWIKSFLKGMATGFVFDFRTQELRITHQVPPSYDFLPSCFPLSEVRAIQLIHLKGTKSFIRDSLELHLQDGKFIPLSVFKDEIKARRVAQELATALKVPVEVFYRAAETFQVTKQRFLNQFQDKV
jgi:hypothetical protein